jgi:hypothetical protein
MIKTVRLGLVAALATAFVVATRSTAGAVTLPRSRSSRPRGSP